MFVFNLGGSPKKQNIKGGEARSANKANFPALEGMSINRLSMKPGTLNPPHWHLNTHEVVYIISGTALFGIRGVHDELSIFKASAGEMVFIEKNYLHYFKSIGNEKLEVGVWFNSDRPTTVSLAGTFRGTPDSVVAQAFEVEEELVDRFSTDTTRLLAGRKRDGEDQVDQQSSFKFNLRDNDDKKVLVFDKPESGQVRIARPSVFSSFEDFSLAHIRLKPGAMRQIHWHQHASELNLVIDGSGEFGIVTPEGDSFVYPVSQGDIMMAPVGYPHYVKNTGTREFEFILGFDHADIASIDVRGSFQAMPRSIKQQTLKPRLNTFEKFNTEGEALLPPVSK